MIKNRAGWIALSLALLGGCRARGGEADDRVFQGVIEYEERTLGFEVSGRLVKLEVRAGDLVRPGDLLARLDDSLARSALAARASEAAAAEDQLALLRAGARGEDVRAMRARLTAAEANQALLERSAARMRALAESGATTPSALEEAETQRARADAERRALAENLAALAGGARKQELLVAQHRLDAARAAAELEKARLERHRLAAQHPGEVLEVHVEAGEMAPAGAPVVTVADVTRPHAEVFVPQAALAGIRAGVPVKARIDAAAEEIAGTVELVRRRTEFTPRYLFSESERGTLVVRVRVRFTDPARRLHAGVPVFVRFAAGEGGK